MQQGITTKYLGPTNTKGGRIKATCWRGSVTAEYNHAGNHIERHTMAAKELALKFNLSGLWVAGGKPEEDGNMYVNIGFPERAITEMRNLGDLYRMGKEGEDWFYVAPKQEPTK